MFSRSELRHACFRAKNNVATDKNKDLLRHVEPLLKIYQKWNNFTTEWDLLVNSKNEIIIIKPEVDYDFIHSICLEVSFLAKRNLKFECNTKSVEYNDRCLNIITIIESLMLDNIMTWKNYNINWGVSVDSTSKQIKTNLYNAPINQIEVTEEMIQNSMKIDEDIQENILNESLILNTEEVTDELQKEKLKEFIQSYTGLQV